MTHDEATAALTADGAALVWAGRDYDALVASFGGHFDPEVSNKMKVAQRAIEAAPDLATRLMEIKDATAFLAGILAAREQHRVEQVTLVAEQKRELAERVRANNQAQARRERAGRAFFPTIQAMHGRLDAALSAQGEAATQADLAAAHDALATDLASAVDTMRQVGASLLPAAA